MISETIVLRKELIGSEKTFKIFINKEKIISHLFYKDEFSTEVHINLEGGKSVDLRTNQLSDRPTLEEFYNKYF